jgi:hypothetical protein
VRIGQILDAIYENEGKKRSGVALWPPLQMTSVTGSGLAVCRNPPTLLETRLELSRDLVGGRLGATFEARAAADSTSDFQSTNDYQPNRTRGSRGDRRRYD